MDNKQEYMCHIVERYLRGEATKSERELMQLWLASDTTFADWLSEQIDSQQSEMDAEVRDRIYRRITSRDMTDNGATPAIKVRRFNPQSIMGYVAAILLAISVGLSVHFLEPRNNDMVSFAISTGIGEHPSVTLPDGTNVNVSPMSHLTYTFDQAKHTRRVILEGQAYFDVAHDVDNPFDVVTEALDIECLGTAFSVKAYAGDETESVVLHNGRVRVTADDKQEVMSPGTRLIYDRLTDQFAKHPVDIKNYPTSGREHMFYDNETLAEIARTFYRDLGVRITIEGADLATQRFYGSIVANDVHTALGVLASATGTHMQFRGDSIVVMSRDY